MRKYISPLIIVIVSVSLSVFALVFVGQQRQGDDKPAWDMTSYVGQRLPQVPLIELKSGEDFFEKVMHDDVLLVFSMIGCDACGKEMQIITENAAEIESGMSIYGVMFEDQRIVDQYVQAHNINLPVLLDKSGKLRKELGLKYFPTNLKLKDGAIVEAWFGVDADEQEFLKRLNAFQR